MTVTHNNDVGDAGEILACIAGTEHRTEIISALADDELDLRDLSDELGIPRTTLRHNLEKLKEYNLVRETIERDYCLTPLGQATLAGLEAFCNRIETEARLEPLFSCISASEFGFDVEALRDAKITVSRQACPYLPGQKLRDEIREADEVTAAVPSLPPLSRDGLSGITSRGNSSVELFLTAAVTEVLSRELSVDLSELTDAEGRTIRVLDDDIAYGLAIIDDRAFIQGLDDEQKPHVLVETGRPACREWVESRLEQYRSASTPLHDGYSKSLNPS